MSLPIIFVREFLPQSGSFDLTPCISSALQWSPHSRVILIGDQHQPKDLCEFHDLSRYSSNKSELRKIFKAKNPSEDWFVWVTLAQWLVIFEWMSMNNVQRACCLDTDVLLFADVEQEVVKLGDWDLSLSCPLTACQAPTFVTLSVLKGFMQFLFDLFLHKPDSDWKNILAGDVNSMSLWSHYVRLCNPKPRVVDTSEVRGGSTWCHNIGMNYGGYDWDGVGRIIQWKSGQPYSKQTLPDGSEMLVRFNSLHMWSVFKSRLKEFLWLSEKSLA